MIAGAVIVAAVWGMLLAISPGPAVDVNGDTAAPLRTHPAPEAQRPPPIEGHPPRALIVGDSYTAGVGATNGDGYAQRLADDLGWNAEVKSAPGGGYGKPGVNGKSVLDLLRTSDLAEYDVIVIQSGYNDVSEDDSAVASAVERTANLVFRRAPKVPVVVIGEFWPGKQTASSQARAATIADGWRDRTNVLFLDPIQSGWSDFDTTDDRHPDDAGHALIAAKVETAMRRAGMV